MTIVVPPSGPCPADVLIIGEAPGRREAQKGKPFVGQAGYEQDRYFRRHGIRTTKRFRKANVVQEYREGNPDPTPEQIEHWTPVLEREIEECRPRVVVAVGRFAMRWFLGDDMDLDVVHGVPFESDRARLVVPVIHPAAGFPDRDTKGTTRALIDWDYEQAVEVIRHMDPASLVAYDEYEGNEDYRDVSGTELVLELSHTADRFGILAVDTEGSPREPWSIQVTVAPGTAFVLRAARDDLGIGIAAVQALLDRGWLLVLHNAMWDIEVCEALGLGVTRPGIQIWDSMYAAYLTRHEPQSLKALALRRCGMRMSTYSQMVAAANQEMWSGYLSEVATGDWPRPDEYLKWSNDGTAKLTHPTKIQGRAMRALLDQADGKVDKDGKPVDLWDRWHKVEAHLRAPMERDLGPMPRAGLGDIDPEAATWYAGRDSDATYRLYSVLREMLEAEGLTDLMTTGMEVLPVFEAMQRNGMPVSRSYFEGLESRMWEEMCERAYRISHRYYGDEPFNPKSPVQVAGLVRRRGLTPLKKTKTGRTSTADDSIGYLRFEDPAMEEVFEWRERQHIRDSFCRPVIARLGREETEWLDEDHGVVRARLKLTRTTSRRPSAEDPNLLNIPTRTELGRLVREGYECPEGELFGAWDHSQIEMRVAAHVSRDPLLCRLFHEGKDVHTMTAAMMYGVFPEDVTREQRAAAKTVNFGRIYGQSAPGMQSTMWEQGLVEWSERDCRDAMRKQARVYERLDEYATRELPDEVRANGCVVRDVWGMPRRLPGLEARSKSVRAEAERIAFNHVVQGGAQGMIQNAMRQLRRVVWELQRAGADVKWRLQVYDEVILSFSPSVWEVVDEEVRGAMVKGVGVELAVPVEVDGAVAETWGGLK